MEKNLKQTMICIAFKIKQKQHGILSEQNAVLAK